LRWRVVHLRATNDYVICHNKAGPVRPETRHTLEEAEDHVVLRVRWTRCSVLSRVEIRPAADLSARFLENTAAGCAFIW